MLRKMIILLLFVALPVCMLCVCNHDFWNKRKEMCQRLVLLLGIEGCVILFLKFVVKLPWTYYEFLLVDCLLYCMGDMFFQLRHASGDFAKIIFRAFFCASMAVVGYSIMTHGQTVVHSDSATAILLTQAQIRHKSYFPKTWCYANGDIWVLLINIFTAPFSILLENQSLARMLGSLTLVVASAAGLYLLSSKLFKDISWLLAVPLIYLLSFGQSDMTLYQAAYTSLILWVPLAVLLAYEVMYNGQHHRGYLAVYGLLAVLLLMGGIRFGAEVAVPVLGTVFVMRYAEFQKGESTGMEMVKKSLINACELGIPAALGYGIYKALCRTHFVVDTGNNSTVFVGSLNDVWNNFVQTVLNAYSVFGFAGGTELFSLRGIRNLASLVLCTMSVFVLPWLQFRRLGEEEKGVQFFFVFGMLHNAVMMVLSVFFGKIEVRYFLTAVIMFDLISASYFVRKWILLKRHIRLAAVAAYAGIFVLCSAVLLHDSSGWNGTLAQKKNFCRTLVEHGLHKGYATFWNAYTNEVYSDLKLEMASIGGDIDPENPVADGQQWWLVDNERFLPEDVDNTFLLLSEEQNEALKEQLPEVYGRPEDYFSVDGMHIYVWDYDIAEWMRNGILDNKLKPKEVSVNEHAAVFRDRVRIKKDGVVYGPYAHLDKGEYEVSIKGKHLSDARCDAYSGSRADVLSFEEVKRMDDTISLRVVLTEAVDDIEFRIFNDGDGMVVFYETDILEL